MSIGDDVATDRVVNSFNRRGLTRRGINGRLRVGENGPAECGGFIGGGGGGESAVGSRMELFRESREVRSCVICDDRVRVMGGKSSEGLAEVK